MYRFLIIGELIIDRATRRRIPDRERGALARVAKLCSELGISFYHGERDAKLNGGG